MSDTSRIELEQELLRLRGERRDLAADLAGENPEDAHGNDLSIASDSVRPVPSMWLAAKRSVPF